MTQKEKLYFEYLRLKNELEKLQGKEVEELSDKILQTAKFQREAASHKLDELNGYIAGVNSHIENELHKQTIERWYGTPDGIRYKAAITRRQNELRESYKKLVNDAEKHVADIVKTVCGTKWDVIRFHVSYSSGVVCIGVVKSRNADGIPSAYFGKSFEVSFESMDINGNPTEEFKMSYSSGNSDDIIEDTVNAEYIAGMGRFLTNRYMLKDLKKYLIDIARKAYKTSRELYKQNELLKEPEQFKRHRA